MWGRQRVKATQWVSAGCKEKNGGAKDKTKTGKKQKALFSKFRKQFKQEFEVTAQDQCKGFTLLQFLNDLAFSIKFAITWHKDNKWRDEMGSPA